MLLIMRMIVATPLGQLNGDHHLCLTMDNVANTVLV
jgi:hypothetical protein